MVQKWEGNQRRQKVSESFLISISVAVYTLLTTEWSLCKLTNHSTSSFRYKFEKDGSVHRLIIKDCRLDDECEYACGVDDRKSRARLFVEGTF